jgi:GT2 family glycosyltransferase
MITTSIIIPTLLADQSFRDCIQSIQDYTDLSGVEVIIVANGCPCSKTSILQTLPHPFLYMWYGEALGFAKAVNVGIRASQGEYIVILNDDCKFLPQERNTWLKRLKDPLQNDSRVGVTSPNALKDPITEYSFLPYYCVMLRRGVLEKVGLLDENFGFGGCEDIDHCIRLVQAGYLLHHLTPYICEGEKKKYVIGDFPLYHEGEHTVIPYFADKQNNWDSIFSNNQELLKQKWVEKRVIISKIPTLQHKRLRFPDKEIITKSGEALSEVLNSPTSRPFDAKVVVPLRLNLGCGDMILPDYTNVDKYNPKADKDWDAVSLPLSNNCVDEIYACHLIEHFDFHQGQEVLKEWKRVLKEGGVLIVETPDFLASCKKFINSNEQERINLYGHFFATPWIAGQIHKFLYTPIQMRWTLELLGFKEIHQIPALRYVENVDANMKFVCRK